MHEKLAQVSFVVVVGAGVVVVQGVVVISTQHNALVHVPWQIVCMKSGFHTDPCGQVKAVHVSGVVVGTGVVVMIKQQSVGEQPRPSWQKIVARFGLGTWVTGQKK
jgi:hypothetical protein